MKRVVNLVKNGWRFCTVVANSTVLKSSLTFGDSQFVEDPEPKIRFKYMETLYWMLEEFAPLKSKHDDGVAKANQQNLLNVIANEVKQSLKATKNGIANKVKQLFLHCHCEPKAWQSFQLHNNRLPRRYAPRNDGGRSMIEILGVLAIIGVLSVGGIAGYSKAMERYKINKTISEYSYLFFNMYEHIDTLKKLPDGTGLANLANQLNFLPASWRMTDNGDRWALDSLGNKIQTWKVSSYNTPRVIFEIYLPNDENSKEGAKKLDLCRSLLKDFIQPLHEFVYDAYVWRVQPETANVTWFGKSYCGVERKCLKDITLTEFDTACRSCVDSKGNCSLVLSY